MVPFPEHYLHRIVAQTYASGGTPIKRDTGDILDTSDTWGFPKYPSQTVILSSDADLMQALYGFIVGHY